MAKYFVTLDKQQFSVTVENGQVAALERLNDEGEVEESLAVEAFQGQLAHLRNDRFQWCQGEQRQDLTIIDKAERDVEVHWRGHGPIEVQVIDEMTHALQGGSQQQGDLFIISQMPGVVLDIRVKPGDSVKPGDVLLILEAMKTENEICAEREGTVKAVHVESGATIADKTLLVELEDPADSGE